MEHQKIKEIIEKAFKMYKPEGVDEVHLKIEPFGYDKDVYFVTPQYIIDKDTGSDLMTVTYHGVRFETKGDKVFDRYEKYVKDFIGKYTGFDIQLRGRGVTEKEYWESNYGKLK